jgi:hypothetical protein
MPGLTSRRTFANSSSTPMSWSYVWIELGAAWGRRIPIVALLLGITPSELQNRPGVPVLLKKLDLLQLNDIETYLKQLRRRVLPTLSSPPDVLVARLVSSTLVEVLPLRSKVRATGNRLLLTALISHNPQNAFAHI